MNTRRLKATNLKVKFAGQVVTLRDENDRQKTRSGVELWIQLKPGNEIRPMASIPDGTLNQYKHDRPELLSVKWEPY